MKKPVREEFTIERKFNGKVYKTINEEAFRSAMRRWERYKEAKQRHKI